LLAWWDGREDGREGASEGACVPCVPRLIPAAGRGSGERVASLSLSLTPPAALPPSHPILASSAEGREKDGACKARRQISLSLPHAPCRSPGNAT